MAIRVSEEEFADKVLTNAQLVIVDFYSDSCVACKRLTPVLGDLEDNFEGALQVFKVNTNFDVDLARKYHVMSNPTLVFIKNGEEVERVVGARSYNDLEELVKKNL